MNRIVYTLLLVLGVSGLTLYLLGWQGIAGYMLLASTLLVLAGFAVGLARGRFTVDLLMGVVGGVTWYHGAFLEGHAVLALYGAAEIIEDAVEIYASKSIRRLAERLPSRVLRVALDGSLERVEVSELRPGDVIMIRMGEAAPVDVVLLEDAQVDLSNVTGEPHPVPMRAGAHLLSGSILLTGPVKARVLRTPKESFTQRLVEEALEALESKPRIAGLIERYVPHITVAVLGAYLAAHVFAGPLRALSILVVGCPSAYILTASYATAVHAALLARSGALLRRADSLELLWRPRTFIVDKTGTLTRLKAVPLSLPENGALSLIAGAALASKHPVARAIAEAVRSVRPGAVDVSEVAGKGMVGDVEIVAGPTMECGKTVVARAPRGEALFCLEEEIVEEARKLVGLLRSMGVRVVIASGDDRERVRRVAEELGVEEFYYGVSPEEKARIVEAYARKGITVFAGDGVNDVLALAKAHVGIAVGSLDAAGRVASLVAVGGARSLHAIFRHAISHRASILAAFSLATLAKLAALLTGLSDLVPLPLVAALGDDGSTIAGVIAASLAAGWRGRGGG